ncbi:MAG: hypothetical protein IKM13_07045 [Clostridia bacterium]|nr:hypothetical protein [Clostridia bacterium]
MKKFFAMLVIISVLVGMFSVAAFAAGATEYDNWFEFWGAARDGETEGEVDGFFGNWHVFKHENGHWYGHYRFLEIGYRGWCPICNDHPTEEPPADEEIESGTTPVESETDTTPVESETNTTPVESETDTTPVESETDTTPVESETDTTPVESETDTTPVESETDTTPVESETDTTPVESETDTTPVESETDTTPVESESDTTPVESESAPVETEKDDNDVPNTGDNSMTALWMTVLGVSAMAFIATLIVGKKKSF